MRFRTGMSYLEEGKRREEREERGKSWKSCFISLPIIHDY